VDPRRLLPSRADLLRGRLQIQKDLAAAGTARSTPLIVTTKGVIFDGHHAIRIAAEEEQLIDVKVVDFPIAPSADSILDLPVRGSS
jgi:hypothetical protein